MVGLVLKLDPDLHLRRLATIDNCEGGPLARYAMVLVNAPVCAVSFKQIRHARLQSGLDVALLEETMLAIGRTQRVERFEKDGLWFAIVALLTRPVRNPAEVKLNSA